MKFFESHQEYICRESKNNIIHTVNNIYNKEVNLSRLLGASVIGEMGSHEYDSKLWDQ